MPTHIALLTDRKLLAAAAFAFALAHGCATADAGANSATRGHRPGTGQDAPQTSTHQPAPLTEIHSS